MVAHPWHLPSNRWWLLNRVFGGIHSASAVLSGGHCIPERGRLYTALPLFLDCSASIRSLNLLTIRRAFRSPKGYLSFHAMSWLREYDLSPGYSPILRENNAAGLLSFLFVV